MRLSRARPQGAYMLITRKVRDLHALSFTVRWRHWLALGWEGNSVNEHDVPPMPQKPPGKGGWDTITTTRQSAHERSRS